MNIAPAHLRDVVRSIFEKRGMSEAHAALTADVLVWADQRGMGTHGVMRVPQYVRFIGKGDLNPKPAMKTVDRGAAVVVLDADRAAGPIAMMAGMRAACEKARAAGIGLALVKSTT